MGEPNDIQAIQTISSEINESYIQITYSNQCHKAQKFLSERLRKESERQKEICTFMNNANIKLETEIKNAEQELKSFQFAHQTIKSANIELEKELLLARENKLQTIERIEKGEKKYENLWLQSKNRYESLPFVQKWLQATNRMQFLKEKIKTLDNDAHMHYQEIKIKKDNLLKLDRERVIKFAQFMVNEMPSNIEIIMHKTQEINAIFKEIDEILKELEVNSNKQLCIISSSDKSEDLQICKINKTDDKWPYLHKNDDTFTPKLQFATYDLDVLRDKLHQIKNKEVNVMKAHYTNSEIINIINETNTEKNYADSFTYYFAKTSSSFTGNTETKTNKKLINVLEDITLNTTDVNNIISKIDIDKIKDVNIISGKTMKHAECLSKSQGSGLVESDKIEEIDLTTASPEHILVPPSPFLDLSQDINSHKQVEVMVEMSMNGTSSKITNILHGNNKKNVSFDLPIANEYNILSHNIKKCDDIIENDESELNVSSGHDISTKIEDIMIKKNHLDTSPQFVYGKNTTLLMMNEDNPVTSKFFKHNKSDSVLKYSEIKLEKEKNENDVIKTNDEMKIEDNQTFIEKNYFHVEENSTKDVSKEEIISESEMHKIEKPVSGILFNHGQQGLPESLDVSLSTTGLEDSEFPHCIDNNLLLSPKAEMSVSKTDGNPQNTCQEMPNFLTGLRTSGLSLFSHISPTVKQDVTSENQPNNFNFNFNNDDKKKRGGLFRLFH